MKMEVWDYGDVKFLIMLEEDGTVVSTQRITVDPNGLNPKLLEDVLPTSSSSGKVKKIPL